MKLAVLVVLFFASVIYAQQPEPCQTPPLWEGRASAYDHGKGVHNRFNISYDGPNRRRRIVDEIDANLPGRSFHEYLFLYNQNEFYTIDRVTGRCNKTTTPPFPWIPYEVPSDATFEGEFTIGGGECLITAVEFSDRVGTTPLSWLGSFTYPGCIPIREVVVTRGPEAIETSLTQSFYDITAGIANPSIWNPPPNCE
ncbi:mammalian ependymin-related protein 1-like [Oscarella lobularis]|uniref:mammalian ependymin-related protein 1-like n=1 Tax=Oscarella lobularis TaxID=121494 RepID=UPI0033139A28